MRRVVFLAILALAGCGDKPAAQPAEQLSSMATKSPEAASADAAEASAPGEVAVDTQQIAYSYRVGFRLPADKIAEAQAAHLKMCDALGQARCHLIAQERRTGDGAGGNMTFEVDTRLARDFADRLDTAVGSAGGSTTSRAVSAEDLSKSIIDTEARIRAKQALADRLLNLIRNRNGKISELVEAERAYADTQEVLDAARSELAAMQRRVSMSRVEAEYLTVGQAGGGSWAIRDAIDSAGLMLGMSLAALIRLSAVLLPWLLIATPLVWAWRRWRVKRRSHQP